MIWSIGIVLFTFQLLAAVFLQYARLKKGNKKGERTNGITVLVPFHNEAGRIEGLIESLNSAGLPPGVEVIFVDDYTTDNTAELFKEKLKVPYKYLKNPGESGKKYAIRFGVNQAQYDTILTWDADIYFDQHYLNTLVTVQVPDLLILPVRMEASSLIGKLSIVEFSFLETLGFGLAKLGKPVICYGTNLLFSKKLFLAVDADRKDYAISSGDDLFLLQAAVQHKAVIGSNIATALTVSTKAPDRLSVLLAQRKRWLGKMGPLLNGYTFWALFMLAGVNIAVVIAFVLAFKFPLFWVLPGIKFLAELIAAWQFVKQSPLNVLIVAIHQIWYPVIALLLLLPAKKEKRWSN